MPEEQICPDVWDQVPLRFVEEVCFVKDEICQKDDS